ncbi:helix-turn-helix domain-containing protein [Haloechinothrix sp. LS1_15]|uniref:helix-turn-helix domain-containing protein n=1 Tax=Haloechinothrix sp. LS1_15 TaxID=2652248 RepID=UPI00294700F4|nr:helix-turn-helix domain-containing protein [Haloechinothrix sp. LS1_15]MDV6011162.1 helix-turn-helix domain-containing protein [Haloechinothrix sp. LS1_15]
MYNERRSIVPGAVVWCSATSGPLDVLPDGCMDLIWMKGELVLAGPDSRPYREHARAGERYTGLRFPPGMLPRLLAVPANELRDSREALRDVAATDAVKRLVDRLGHGDDPAACLESFALDQRHAQPDARTSTIVRLIASHESVSTVADHVNVSERQLHRWSLRLFGYGPKTLARILRFQAALRLAKAGHSGAEVATRSGYADQAHLLRETRQLAGTSFAQLTGARAVA